MPTAELKYVNNYKSSSGHWHLIGEVFNHPKYDDRTLVTTSRVESYRMDNDCYYFTTRHTLYIIKRDQLAELFSSRIFGEVESL